jgi:basic amino acid/polyamine antiporter, APA family
MQQTETAAPSEEGLVRGIGRWDLLFLVLNAIIGAGIFGLPARVYGLIGTYSLLAYFACAVVVVLLLLCFAEVGSRFRTTGGPYLYAYEAFGPAAGFEMGWLLWLARLTAFAALTNLWLDYLGFFLPGVTQGAMRSVAISLIVLAYTALNIRGVRNSTLMNDVLTVSKLVPLTLFVVVGLFFIDGSRLSFGAPPTPSAFSAAVLLLVFAFSGFEMAVIPAGESQEPQKHLPFALLTGIGIIAVLYIMIQVVSIGTLPTLAESTRPLADAAAGIFGTPAAAFISLGALISISGTLNVIVMVSPRLPFAMAARGQLPEVFGALHPTYRTPWVSILVSAVVMLVFTLQGSFISSLTISTMIRLITYAATCAALPVLRRRSFGEAGGFHAPGGTLTAVLAVGCCIWLVMPPTGNWKDVRLTLIAAVIGLVLYFFFGRGGVVTPEPTRPAAAARAA